MIRPGQTYRSLTRRHAHGGAPIRIKVVGEPNTVPGGWNFGKVDVVTLAESGREIRRRRIEATQLHDSATTKSGQPRRAGYVLEQFAGGAA